MNRYPIPSSSLLSGVLLLSLLPMTFAQSNPDAVAKVKANQLQEAKASWWGFDPEDATAFLQAAINSGVPKLVVDDVGQPWVVEPIFLVSHQEIVFEKGVVVQAKKGSFKGKGDCLFTASGQENITLTGYDATWRMNRADYDSPAYEKAEWRHALSIRSSRNIKVYGLTLTESGGDGIYLGVSKRGVSNTDIQIKDVTCDRNYRQGISVISAENLLIEDTVLSNTAGTPPQAGIDFEPNHDDEKLVNCVMRNCIVENNAGDGFDFYLPNLNANSDPISIHLENCTVRGGNRIGFRFVSGNGAQKAVQGTVAVVNCRFEGSEHSGIVIGRNSASGVRIQFDNCIVSNVAKNQPTIAPILLQSAVGCTEPIGGVDFGQLRIDDPVERPFLQYEDRARGVGLSDITGTITVHHDDAETVHQITPQWLEATFPVTKYASIPRFDTANTRFEPLTDHTAGVELRPFALRGRVTFALLASQDEAVSFGLRYSQVGKYSGETMPVHAISPTQETFSVGEVPFNGETTLRFTAPEAGRFHLRCEPGANRVELVSASCPVVVSGESEPIHLFRATGDFYFYVPPGTKEFGVGIWGDGPGEAIQATIFDPTGRSVWEKDNITSPEFFRGASNGGTEGGVWRLKMAPPTDGTYEDYYLDLRGIPPLLASHPNLLMRPVR